MCGGERKIPVEKIESVMEYFEFIDDVLEQPILVGVEHDGGLINGIMIRNINTGTVISLRGIELQAVMEAVKNGKYRFHVNKPKTKAD